MVLLSALSLFPLYWMVVSSLRPANAMFETGLWPSAATLANYRYTLDAIPVAQMLLNTVLVSSCVTVIQLLTAILAAYAFTRWRFRGEKLAYALVVMIPNFLLVADLGLLDSLTALIIPHFASALAVLMMTQAMRSFPGELIDAARVDGSSDWGVLWRIIVPNLGSTLASLAILIFISTWNEYFWPLLLSRSPENTMIQIGIQMFMTAEGNQWGPLMAASTMASLPILALYVVLQRQVIQSFMRSGLR
jgi:sn-glycerol 3-phosphate transport system permease protein